MGYAVSESQLLRWAVAIQVQTAVVRQPAAQRQRSVAQAKIAAQIRWITTARVNRTAATKRTAVNKKNALAALVVATRQTAAAQSSHDVADNIGLPFKLYYFAIIYYHFD